MLQRRMFLTSIAGLGVLAAAVPARGQQTPEKLVFVFSRPRANPHAQFVIRLYTEALGRLGIGFEFLEVPPTRATALSSAGLVDGELGRTYEWVDLYPMLVRVEEPNAEVLFSAFALKPLPPMDGWSALRATSLAICHRQGIQEIEREFADPVYRGRTTSVGNIASAFRMLKRGRADVYVEVFNAVDEFLISPEARQEDLVGLRPIQVGVMLRTTGHAYLHERHRALAPKLSAVLSTMKAEGKHARYLAEALAGRTTEDSILED
jgi:polar amino acid transport system substrate-binding protein